MPCVLCELRQRQVGRRGREATSHTVAREHPHKRFGIFLARAVLDRQLAHAALYNRRHRAIDGSKRTRFENARYRSARG